ncbi:hypothetical protein ABID26_004319 [Mesorhizobium shonense]|uniref:Uncharacterized protein n=1 Tax=Mesorhizobium shonense TaxID=1209948 RepID=A0ABV2HWC6_9HYPH
MSLSMKEATAISAVASGPTSRARGAGPPGQSVMVIRYPQIALLKRYEAQATATADITVDSGRMP